MIYTFGNFELHTGQFTLYSGGLPIRLRPKVFGVLRHLIDQRSRVVSRDDLCDAVWDGRIISNATIESTVMAVRQAVGDNGERQDIIQTLPGHGYRFIASVNQMAQAEEADATPTALEPLITSEGPISTEPVARHSESMHILLVDDHTLFREALLHVLKQLDQCSVIVEAGTTADASRLISHYRRLDLILLDLAMPGMDGLTALPEIRKLAPTVPIVIVSASENRSDVQCALDGGAVGYIPKSCSSHEMLAALRIVLQGNVFVPPKLLIPLETDETVSEILDGTDVSRSIGEANLPELEAVY